ncbi:hypothetical protein HHK36_013701 [Tetracentron sinense]|uniref:Ionotropic glutamate receptor C-terminal domain-containing protein n=1 Tax=Tetracentron sinense TaxID=13715 RepID=A0A834Z8N8_TETSI|nr:hypothetical protein HHK36_013701 [Tetracentron sinense]
MSTTRTVMWWSRLPLDLLKMVKSTYLLVYLIFLSLSFWAEMAIVRNPNVESNAMVDVGVVLDLSSKVGKMAEMCVSMAWSDFYAAHANYKTRLVLHKRDSKGDVVGAASVALELLKNVEVQAIIGPQRSAEAKFVTHLGRKAHVPILSFSATSPSLSPKHSPYFVRTTLDDSSQVKAIAAIVDAFGWREVVPINEDTDFGNGMIPYLIDAFQGIDTRVPYRSVIPPTASDLQILEELNKLATMQTRVFVVHMTASLGSRLFKYAHKAEMMSDGYAWIITDGLSMILDPMNPSAVDSMQGVLGIQPYIPKSKSLHDFHMRWKRGILLKNPNSMTNELNHFGIWAYDTIWALAMAVERVGGMNSRFSKTETGKNSTDLATLGISEIGERLLKTILNTRFKGLSGEFHLVEGQLQSSAFEIFNVIGKGERVIGYWTPKRGLSRGFDTVDKIIAYSTSNANLKDPIWPGDSRTTPKGWAVPIKGKKLIIGVPVKKGFREFVKVERDSHTNKTTFEGFSKDVFLAVLDTLPFALPYEFKPYMKPDGSSNGSYDELVKEVKLQNFDAVVGDITIVANRSSYVDFTLPYSESGVSMVVLIKDDETKNAWIFLKPLSWDLWLTTGAAFIFTGVVVWILEHRLNTEFRGPRGQQLGMMLWFSFSTLVFAHSNCPYTTIYIVKVLSQV